MASLWAAGPTTGKVPGTWLTLESLDEHILDPHAPQGPLPPSDPEL